MILGNRGSWPARAEMLRRAVQDPEVQGGEWSMAQYLYRMEKGDRRYVGLPVFPLRNFTARDLYVRRDGPSGGPRIWPAGASACTATRPAGRSGTATSCATWAWIRRPSSGGSATSTRRGRTPMDQTLPPGVKTPPPGRSLSDMLVAGDLEAIYSPPRPQAYHPHRRAHRQTVPGLPPGRAGVLPQDRRLSAAAPDRPAARGLGGEPLDRPGPHRGVHARPTTSSPRRRRGFPYATPWLEAELEDTEAVMGQDFHPVRARAEPGADRDVRRRGVPPGSHRRRVTVEEYFQDFLAS